MKIQCVLCREIVAIGPFAISGERIEIRCAACAGRFSLDASTGEAGRDAGDVPAAAAAPGPDEMRCPKCALVQPVDEACRSCGLAHARFASYEPASRDVAPALDAAWQRCREAWSDAGAHERFLEAVANQMAFRDGARRYRLVLSSEPGDPVAPRQLERLASMAQAALLTGPGARPAREPEPYRKVMLLLAFMVLLVLAGGIYALTGAREPRRPDDRVGQPAGKSLEPDERPAVR